jgi:hypothetical protein
MLQGVLNQSQNMVVRKRIVDVFCFPTPFDEPRGVESLEASGNGGQFLVFQFRQFRDADLTGGKPRQQSKPGWFAERPEHCRRIIELTGMRQLWPGALLAHQCSIIPSTDGTYSLRMGRQGSLDSNMIRPRAARLPVPRSPQPVSIMKSRGHICVGASGTGPLPAFQ